MAVVFPKPFEADECVRRYVGMFFRTLQNRYGLYPIPRSGEIM